jgi:hypothetical protein
MFDKKTQEFVAPLAASDLLLDKHLLHNTFKAWCVEKGTELTRRQAAKFLQAHPAYRQAKSG